MHDIRNPFSKDTNINRDVASFEWLNLEDQSTIQLILETFADRYKKKILDVSSDKPRSVTEMLDLCEMPSTSGYRIIKSLVENNLLVPTGSFVTRKGRTSKKYISVFENMKIDIADDELIIRIKLAKNFPKT